MKITFFAADETALADEPAGDCINGETLLKAAKCKMRYFVSDNQGAESATNSNVLSGDRKYQKSNVHNTRDAGDVTWEF